MDIVLHHEEGYGWKSSFKITGITYNGEYKLTPHEALAAAWNALGICRAVRLGASHDQHM